MNIKDLCALIGISICVSNSVVLFITFLYAFINGGKFSITINLYSEALPELIIIPVTIIMSIYGLSKYIKKIE